MRFNGELVQADGTWWIDTCMEQFQVHIIKGENRITMDTEFADNTDLEAVYILGAFGVYDDVLRPRAEKITFGDITKQGFAFYGGKMCYRFAALYAETTGIVWRGVRQGEWPHGGMGAL